MPDNNTPNYIAPLIAIITGSFTLLGVWLANRSNKKRLDTSLKNENKRLKNEILRERFEELYTSFEKWAGEMVIHHTTLRKVMEGELNYNQALDLRIERESKLDSHRMFMIAELYFSECHEELEEIKKIRDEASKLQDNFKSLYKQSGRSSIQHADLITEILTRFNTAVDNYKKSLVQKYLTNNQLQLM